MTDPSRAALNTFQKLAPDITRSDHSARANVIEIAAEFFGASHGRANVDKPSYRPKCNRRNVPNSGAKRRSTQCKPRTFGQPRRRITRSTSLSERSALELIAAAQEAVDIGLPLNVLLTVNLEQGQLEDCTRGLGQLLTYLREWIRKQGMKTAFIWCQERGTVVGQHVHILLHLPPTLRAAFMKRHRGWVAQCGATSSSGLIHSRSVGKSPEAAFGDEQTLRDYITNLSRTVHYILKEVVGPARERLGITEPAKGGEVLNKRSGTSQNLGRAARKRRRRGPGPATPWQLASEPLFATGQVGGRAVLSSPSSAALRNWPNQARAHVRPEQKSANPATAANYG